MKYKYFLRGLGIGIIFSAIVLSVSFHNMMTDTKIISKAKQLGMVFKEEEKLFPDATATPVPEQTEIPQQTTPAPTAKPPGATETPAPVSTDTSEKAEKVKVNIKHGLSSHEIAKLLYKKGLVDNKDEFSKYLMEKEYTHDIKYGSYKLKKGLSYHDLAKIILK